MDDKEINLYKHNKSFLLTKKICLIINSLKKKLDDNNIIIKRNGFVFNFKKINPNSFALQKNITGIMFSSTNEITNLYAYNPKIFLTTHYERIFDKFYYPKKFDSLCRIKDPSKNYERISDKKFGYPKKIDTIFPVKDLLKNLFNIIDIKLYENNDIDIKNVKSINTIIKQLEIFNIEYKCYFKFLKEQTEIIKREQEYLQKLNNDLFKILYKYHSIKIKNKEITKKFKEELFNFKRSLINFNLNKIMLSKNFLLYTIKVEPIFFSEIFNFKTEKQDTDEISYIKQLFIYHAKQIYTEFKKMSNTTKQFYKFLS